ncbi:MAG TPA: alpha/beta hydrolase, partial [Candidatus Binataceae bacterium]|nr:alpha/beta hydrolase [Candidatus Binataceae bacterium]
SRFSTTAPRLHFLEWNPDAARTVILLHGNSANAWWWQWVADAMPRDLRILALDLRGHGDSEWVSPPAYKPYDYATDLAKFIGEEVRGERPIVVGHSMGGVVTLAFASRHAEAARGIIVIDTAVVSSRGRDRFLHRLKALPTVVYPDLETAKARYRLMPNEGEIHADRVLAIAEKSLMPAQQGGYTLKFDRESFFGGDGLQVMDTIRALSLPTLLVRAEKSRIMTQPSAEEAAASNPHVRLAVIAGAHHHVILEKPAQCEGLIAEFVSKLS